MREFLLEALWQGVLVLVFVVIIEQTLGRAQNRRRREHLAALKQAEIARRTALEEHATRVEETLRADQIERQAWLDRYAALRGVAVPVERQPAPPREEARAAALRERMRPTT